MSKFIGNCVVMGVKSRIALDGKRVYRSAMLYFEDDTTSLEASVSEDHEVLYRQMESNKMKPAQVTVNLREFKGQRFIEVTGYQLASGAESKPAAAHAK